MPHCAAPPACLGETGMCTCDCSACVDTIVAEARSRLSALPREPMVASELEVLARKLALVHIDDGDELGVLARRILALVGRDDEH